MEVDSVEVDVNRDPNENASVLWKKPTHLSSREEQESANVVRPTTHSLLDLLGTQHTHKSASFEDSTLGKHNLEVSPLEDIKRAQKLVKQSKTSIISEEKLYEHGLSPFPTCEPSSKSIGTSAKCLGVKRTPVDTNDLSSHPPKISKISSHNWASAMNMLSKVNQSSSLIPETCSTTVPTPMSTKCLSAQDAQLVYPLGSPKMPGQSFSLDQQTHNTENFSIAVFNKSGVSGKDIQDVKTIPMILDGAQKCVSPASVAIEEESDLVQISKSIGDRMTQMAYLALVEERKMQNTLAAEVSRLKEVNGNLLSRIDCRISENLQLEKVLKQERESKMLELDTDTKKEKFKAEVIKCKTELVKSNVTNGKLRKNCDALKAELDKFLKRENLNQDRERVMSLEKELESQREKYRVDISEYQSQLENSKKRAAQLLERATYLEAELPNREAAAVSAFKTSSDYHNAMEAAFKKAYEDCRAVLKEYCPELDCMVILDVEDCDQNCAEKDA